MKTSIRDSCMMKRIATRPQPCSCKNMRAALFAKSTNVSLMTVSRRLSDKFGLKSHKPARRPRLTIVMIFKRWGEVLFSDVSLVQQFVVCTRQVRRPPVKRYDEKCTISTTRYPPSQMIWGATCNVQCWHRLTTF